MTDLINLSFCCEQTTVITDFSDLESLGKSHYLATHGGCAPVDVYDALNGEGIARDLIASGDGQITPYGVVYDNGMKLEQLYSGLAFHPYYCEPKVLDVEMKPFADEMVTLLQLPMSNVRLDRLLERGDISRADECFIKVGTSFCPAEIIDSIEGSLGGVKAADDIFLILPEEDSTKNFMAGLMIQNLSRELFAVADENGGKLKNRVVLYCDELGTMPPFDILPLFSAGRSRKLTLVPIIQSLAQLEKNYGKEGAEIITDNCQDTIFGGFAPNSQTAEVLSKALGSRTVMSGSISKSKNDPSESLQMMERPLMTPDELKSIPKGEFIVMKTGAHPMQTRLRLFLDWVITFGKPYVLPERAAREVAYADKNTLLRSINARYPRTFASARTTRNAEGGGSIRQTDAQAMDAELPEALEEKAEYHYNLGDGGVTP